MGILVFADNSTLYETGRNAADRISAPFITDLSEIKTDDVVLKVSENGVSLNNGKMEIMGDFKAMFSRIRNNNLNGELLVRAAKINGRSPSELRVTDATAGLGEDSFLLAAAGYNVTMYERDPVIYLMLEDALRRGSGIPEISHIISRMKCVEGDSLKAFPGSDEHPDIIYLDPMFPARQKSGLVKKKFQLLHYLEAPCADEKEMMEAALSAEPMKIIIKRPLKAASLAGIRPSYSLTGKSIRFDVIIQG